MAAPPYSTASTEVTRLPAIEQRARANGVAGLRWLDAGGLREVDQIAAGLGLHAASVDSAEAAALVLIYTLIATSTVVIPIIASFLAPKRVQPKLVSARDWISANGRVLTSAMMFMIGVVIFGAGLTHL